MWKIFYHWIDYPEKPNNFRVGCPYSNKDGRNSASKYDLYEASRGLEYHVIHLSELCGFHNGRN